jgi:pimeloyl-ACP methyl ester carboxylesterase
MRPSPAEWRARGRDLEILEGRIFTVDLGPPGGAAAGIDPVMILHGFPLSSWTFAEAAARLAQERRVILVDFLGFGFSAKPPDASYSLFDHADVAVAVAGQLGLRRVHIWAHDMGTSVATELLARRERGLLPFDLASVVLMAGGVFVEMSRPTLAQRVLMSPAGPALVRTAGGNKAIFVRQMGRTFARTPAPEVLDGIWTLLTHGDGGARMPFTIRFMHERRQFRRRWIGALHRLDLPAMIGWGAADSVTPLPIGERLARETPGARLTAWPGLGHHPQLEDPALVAEAVAEFLRLPAPLNSRSATTSHGGFPPA